MIPLSIPDLRGPVSKNLNKVIKSNWVSSAGPEIKFFEKSVAKYVKRKYAIATSSGSSALFLSLFSCGVKPGDKVLVPDYTFSATVNAVLIYGAEPVFVDVCQSNWTIDINLVEIAIKKFKPSAIIAVDTLGHPFHKDDLVKICKVFRTPLIEDSAGALGSRYKDTYCGSLSDIGVFSFNGNKIITTGSGGMMLTNNKVYAKNAHKYLSQFRKKLSYEYEGVGFNFKMANVNASIGLTQMPHLSDIIRKKKLIAKRYDKYFLDRDDVLVMPREEGTDSSCWLYSIRLCDIKSATSLIKHFAKLKIEARLFWFSLSRQAPYKSFNTVLSGVSADLSGTVVSIPCSSSLSYKDQMKVINAFGLWRGNKIKHINMS